MIKRFLPILILFLILLSCLRNNSIEPRETKGTIQGTVKSINNTVIHRAYLFSQDSLLADTNEQGIYVIAAVEEGLLDLTCSALNYRDTTVQVQVKGGKIATVDFVLAPDSTIGRVYGEFQDLNIFSDSLQSNPGMADWDAKYIFDAVTGATIQYKTFHYEIPERRVFLGDSLLVTADAWGQYWFKIQSGTYRITGSCDGYYDVARIIRVLPNSRNYINFFLTRKEIAKYIVNNNEVK